MIRPSRLYGVLCGLLLALLLGLESGRAQPGQTPTAAPTEDPTPHTLLVWWPGPLAPEAGSAADRALRRQIADYEAARSRTISLRIKKPEGAGGIYEMLYSASLVAPAIVPDAIIVRHSQLANAAAQRLLTAVDLQAMEFNDLFSTGTPLGRVADVQYGVPYILELQHIVYRKSSVPTPPRTLDDLLSAGQFYLFPARGGKSVSPTLLAQYVAAGGRIVDENERPVIDREPLLTVLRHYEQSLKAGIAGPELVDYSGVGQYWAQFMTGRANVAQIDSTTFLAQRSGGMALGGSSAVDVADLPMPGTNRPAIVDGWVWAVTATTPERQAQALDAIAWFMDAERQAEFTRAVGMLPSRLSALALWEQANDPYAAFARKLLEGVAAPLPDMVAGNVAAALQEAFEDVLFARTSADEAAAEAVQKVTNG